MNLPLIICSVILATMMIGARALRNRVRASKSTGGTLLSTIHWYCATMALVLLGIVGQVVAYVNMDDGMTDPLLWMNMALAGVSVGILAAFGPFQTLRTARTDNDPATNHSGGGHDGGA